MSWNYRVLRYKDGCVGIHEVYYDEDGRPEGCTERPVGPVGDDVGGLRGTLSAMLYAIDEPELDYDRFGSSLHKSDTHE